MATSYEKSLDNLKLFFRGSKSSYITKEDIFINTDRADISDVTNRNWLYSKLSDMREHGLFVKIRGVEDGSSVLKGIRLTSKGKAALGFAAAYQPSSTSTPSVGVRDPNTQASVDHIGTSYHDTDIGIVKAHVKALRKKYPDLDIIFDVKLKKDEEDAPT